jgi:hypothetical protein
MQVENKSSLANCTNQSVEEDFKSTEKLPHEERVANFHLNELLHQQDPSVRRRKKAHSLDVHTTVETGFKKQKIMMNSIMTTYQKDIAEQEEEIKAITCLLSHVATVNSHLGSIIQKTQIEWEEDHDFTTALQCFLIQEPNQGIESTTSAEITNENGKNFEAYKRESNNASSE